MLAVEAIVRFLAARLNRPRPYQREDGKGAGAVERDLQDDLLDWWASGALTQGVTFYEPQDVGGGRADLVIAFSSQRIVHEVKREQRDSSKTAMEHTYAEQAVSYGAADYPFGIIPILDISAQPPSTPHLAECVWVHRHQDAGGTRWLVFVRVPGRLVSPSEHTKRARSAS